MWDLTVETLTARLTISLNPGSGSLSSKLSGWPSVSLSLSVRPSETSEPPLQHSAELLKNLTSQALRCAQIDIK